MKTYEVEIECTIDGADSFVRKEYFSVLSALPFSVVIGKAISRTIDLFIQLGCDVDTVSFRYVPGSYGSRDSDGFHSCSESK